MITRRNEEEYQKHWKRCTSVRSPYMPELLYHKTKFIDGTESYSEAFNPTLKDRHPRYDTDTNLCDTPPTPLQQREVRFTLKASRKKTEHAAVKNNMSAIPAEGKPYVKHQ
jgi:hypothetical protein